MSLYLGSNLISGVATPTEPTRNLGQIIESIVPLQDAGLHLLDGALINGSGIYSAFVTAIGNVYNNTSISKYKSNIITAGSLINNNGVLSGFSSSNYATIPNTFTSANLTEAQIVFTTGTDITTTQGLFLGSVSDDSSTIGIYNGGLYLMNKVSGSSTSYDSLGLSLATSTKYYFKFIQSGTTITPYISTDGQIYTQGTTVTRSKDFGLFIGYGLGNDLSNTPMLGSIDLTESYININDTRWWTGAEAIKPMFCTEEQWQQSVNTYGVCGKFVYTPEVPTYYAWYITANGAGSTLYYTMSTTVSVGDKIYTKSGNSFVEQATLTSGNSGWNVYNSQPRYNSYGTTRKSTADETGSPATVRLPKITGIVEGTTDVTALGDLVEAGLPDHAHSYARAAFSQGHGGEYPIVSSNNVDATTGNASASNTIYGNSTTVQPQTIKVLYYIVIATTTKTEIEVDIDEIATDLNGKADVDLSNMSASQSAKNTIMSWSMPDYTSAISFTFSPSNSYTAPCNGYISLISNRAVDYISNVKVNGEVITGSLAYYTNIPYIFPVSSGDIVSTDHNSFSGTGTGYLTFNAIFIPMKGAN